LDKISRHVLHTVAGFRMPTTYDTLASVLVGTSKPSVPFAREDQLDASLIELEDRGLLGWDKPANQYDLQSPKQETHSAVPIGMFEKRLGTTLPQTVVPALHDHFQNLGVVASPILLDPEVRGKIEALTLVHFRPAPTKLGRADRIRFVQKELSYSGVAFLARPVLE
jgi:hypothetical protein